MADPHRSEGHVIRQYLEGVLASQFDHSSGSFSCLLLVLRSSQIFPSALLDILRILVTFESF